MKTFKIPVRDILDDYIEYTKSDLYNELSEQQKKHELAIIIQSIDNRLEEFFQVFVFNIYAAQRGATMDEARARDAAYEDFRRVWKKQRFLHSILPPPIKNQDGTLQQLIQPEHIKLNEHKFTMTVENATVSGFLSLFREILERREPIMVATIHGQHDLLKGTWWMKYIEALESAQSMQEQKQKK